MMRGVLEMVVYKNARGAPFRWCCEIYYVDHGLEASHRCYGNASFRWLAIWRAKAEVRRLNSQRR